MEELNKKNKTNKNKGSVPKKRPGAQSNHYDNVNIDVPSGSESRASVVFF